jgi:hypothetical protein
MRLMWLLFSCTIASANAATLQHTTLSDGVYLAGNFMQLGVRKPPILEGGRFGATSVPTGFMPRKSGYLGK